MNKKEIREIRDEQIENDVRQSEQEEGKDFFKHLEMLDYVFDAVGHLANEPFEQKPETDLEEREAMGILHWENTINEN